MIYGHGEPGSVEFLQDEDREAKKVLDKAKAVREQLHESACRASFTGTVAILIHYANGTPKKVTQETVGHSD